MARTRSSAIVLSTLALLLGTFFGVTCRVGAADAAADVAPPQDIPTAAQQAAALKQLKTIYKPFPPAKPAAKAELAKQLLTQAKANKDDPVSQYVMLHEAQDMSVSVGDVPTSLAAASEIGRTFKVDPRKETLAVLKKIKPGAQSPAGAAVAALTAATNIGWDALRSNDMENATTASSVVSSFLRSATDPKMVASAQALTTEVHHAEQDNEHVKVARQTLAKNPEDPEATLAVGRFVCLRQGDWSQGLPLLAKSSDAALAGIAKKDVTEPATPDERSVLADAWRERASKETGLAATRCRQRACYWYEKAIPTLAGLRKTAAEHHEKELRVAIAKDPLSGSEEGKLTDKLNDFENWTIINGKWLMPAGHLRGEGDSGIKFNEPIPGNIAITFNFNVVAGNRPRFYFDGTNLMFGNEGYTHALNAFGVTPTKAEPFNYVNDKPHLATFTFSGGRYNVSIDGAQVSEGPCTQVDVMHLSLRAGDGFSPGITEFWDFKVMPAGT